MSSIARTNATDSSLTGRTVSVRPCLHIFGNNDNGVVSSTNNFLDYQSRRLIPSGTYMFEQTRHARFVRGVEGTDVTVVRQLHRHLNECIGTDATPVDHVNHNNVKHKKIVATTTKIESPWYACALYLCVCRSARRSSRSARRCCIHA